MKYVYLIILIVVAIGIVVFFAIDSDDKIHEKAKGESISLFEELFVGDFENLKNKAREAICKEGTDKKFVSVSKEKHGKLSLYVCRYEDDLACSLLSSRNNICNPVKITGYETKDYLDRGKLICLVNGYIVSGDGCVIIPGQSCRLSAIVKGSCL